MKHAQSTHVLQNEWQVCNGEVGRLVRKLRWRQRTRYIKRDAVLLVFTFAVLCTGYLHADTLKRMEVRLNGCTCDHFMQQMQDFYCEKTRADMDAQLWEHLSKCADCRNDLVFRSRISHSTASHSEQPRNRAEIQPNAPSLTFAPSLKHGATFAAAR